MINNVSTRMPILHPAPNLPQVQASGAEQNPLPLVTIAIACYNQARFLGDAIESAQAQGYGNVEIVVVDDGSTDNTAEVAAYYPNLKTIRQRNQGLSAARNAAIRDGHGEYIVFLDADDRLLPRAVEIGVLCFDAHPECAFVSGQHRMIQEDGQLLLELPPLLVESDHYLALLRGNYIGMHATVLYRRSLLEQIGGFDTTLPACEDYDLYLRVARDYPVYCHDEVITEYRQHGMNMSHDPNLMLTQVVGVLQRQWPHVRRNLVRQHAYVHGLLAWQAHYGRKRLDGAAVKRAEGKGQEALRWLAPIIWRTPLFAAYHTAQWAFGRGYGLLYRLASPSLREGIAKQLYRLSATPVGRIDFGDLRSLQSWKGSPEVTPAVSAARQIDQEYIDSFLASQAHYVRGDVLHLGATLPKATFSHGRVRSITTRPLDESTLLDDLRAVDALDANRFDCIVAPHLLHRVFELQAAMHSLTRLLKPGGVLLVTLPGVGLVKRAPDADAGYWAFTSYAAQQLFASHFPAGCVRAEAKGNVLATVALLQGIGSELLLPEEMAYADSQFEVVITVRAIKGAAR